MTAVALWLWLGLIPKYLPPAPVHSAHTPPANPTLTLAPQCVVQKSQNGLLTLKVCSK